MDHIELFRGRGVDGRTYSRRGVHGWVVHATGRRIVAGEIAPGAILPRESEMMQQLGVSRTAIREAIKVLAAKGLVETRPKTGTQVNSRQRWNLLDPDVLGWQAGCAPPEDLLCDLVEVRELIEPRAARLAALRANAEERTSIEQALAAMRAALDDADSYYRADLIFHRAIFAACHNEFIDRLGAIVSTLLKYSFTLQRRSLVDREKGLALHRAVVTCLVAGDPEGAEAAMRAIIALAREELRLVTERPTHGERAQSATSYVIRRVDE